MIHSGRLNISQCCFTQCQTIVEIMIWNYYKVQPSFEYININNKAFVCWQTSSKHFTTAAFHNVCILIYKIKSLKARNHPKMQTPNTI